MDIKESDILGEEIARHWYYRAKAQALLHFLDGMQPAGIRDVGAGSGYFARHLLTTTQAREAWCVDVAYTHEWDACVAGKPMHYRRSIGRSAADLVLLMDVLEHVDDDIGLLAYYVERLPRGTRFLISVPAFQSLWSAHDVFLEHKRRYRLRQIEGVARDAGLNVLRGSYGYAAVLPLVAVMRLTARVLGNPAKPARSQLKPHHPLINGSLALLCRLELPLLRRNRLAGLTAYCLAEKR